MQFVLLYFVILQYNKVTYFEDERVLLGKKFD